MVVHAGAAGRSPGSTSGGETRSRPRREGAGRRFIFLFFYFFLDLSYHHATPPPLLPPAASTRPPSALAHLGSRHIKAVTASCRRRCSPRGRSSCRLNATEPESHHCTSDRLRNGRRGRGRRCWRRRRHVMRARGITSLYL